MRSRRLAKSEDGSILVEQALIVSLMLLILGYTTDYALWVQKAMQLQSAASAGAAYGTIPGSATNTTMMSTLATFDATHSLTAVSGVNVTSNFFYTCTPGGTTVTSTTLCSGIPPLQYVQVTASSTPNALLRFPGIPTSLGLTGSAIYRVQGTP